MLQRLTHTLSPLNYLQMFLVLRPWILVEIISHGSLIRCAGEYSCLFIIDERKKGIKDVSIFLLKECLEVHAPMLFLRAHYDICFQV